MPLISSPKEVSSGGNLNNLANLKKTTAAKIKRGVLNLTRSNVQAGSKSSLSETDEDEIPESLKSEGEKTVNKPAAAAEIKVETSTILPALKSKGITKSLESISDENVLSLN